MQIVVVFQVRPQKHEIQVGVWIENCLTEAETQWKPIYK